MQLADDEFADRDPADLLDEAMRRSVTLVEKIRRERDDLALRAKTDSSLTPGIEIMDKALAAAHRMLDNLRAAENVAPWNDPPEPAN